MSGDNIWNSLWLRKSARGCLPSAGTSKCSSSVSSAMPKLTEGAFRTIYARDRWRWLAPWLRAHGLPADGDFWSFAAVTASYDRPVPSDAAVAG